MAQANYASYKVVVRSYYEGMTTSTANSMDQIYEEYKSELTTATNTSTSTNNGTRNLRASSRELQSWCQVYCPGQCTWCKTNDVLYGQNCNNYCRRREKEAEPRDLSATDGFAPYPRSLSLFTAQQKADCSLILASLVRTAHSKLHLRKCHLTTTYTYSS
jgi:hypothetical protein